MSDQRPHLKTLEEIERDCLPGLGEDKMGPDLADAMEEQSTRLGAEMRTDDVVRVDPRSRRSGCGRRARRGQSSPAQ